MAKGMRNKVKPWKIALARKMAKNQTHPERVLWDRLKDSQLGIPVVKQSILYGFIVDFYAPQAKLAIECDGPHHLKQVAYDRQRDAILIKNGILTMRFTSDAIETNPQVVVAMIKAKIQERTGGK